MYVYQIVWIDYGVEEIKWETMDLIVASILYDYFRALCQEYNDLSMSFSMDCVLETREII